MLRPVSILLLAAAVSTPAFAHAGDHHFTDLLTPLLHFFSDPFHSGALMAAGIASLALRAASKRRARATLRRRQR